MTVDRSIPYAWSGPPGREQEPLTVPYLMQAGNMDAPVAAILWALMHRRPSIIVAAMPQRAGKTATLTALLDFLPPTVQRIYLRGGAERFEFVGSAAPTSSLMLANELSDHLPYYLWGRQANQAFRLLNTGYALAATMHADSPEEVVGEVMGGLGLDPATVGNLTAVVNLAVFRNPLSPSGEPTRRVRVVSLISHTGASIHCADICNWDPKTDTFAISPKAADAIANRLALDVQRVNDELSGRAAYLEKLRGLANANRPEAFQQAVRDYSGPVA